MGREDLGVGIERVEHHLRGGEGMEPDVVGLHLAVGTWRSVELERVHLPLGDHHVGILVRVDDLSLADILLERGEPVTVERAAELAMELQEQGGFSGIFFAMSEDDVIRIMKHPQTMIASDGGIPTFGRGVPHPRNYGTFPRVLGRYVREQGVISFEDAIRRMTSLPARRLGLNDRGVLRNRNMADVVVLDPETVIDKATFKQPHRYSEGIVHVFVNGRAVLLNGKTTGTRPGISLRSHH